MSLTSQLYDQNGRILRLRMAVLFYGDPATALVSTVSFLYRHQVAVLTVWDALSAATAELMQPQFFVCACPISTSVWVVGCLPVAGYD